jgi:4-hydroxy-tetrahydrodipicolinate synthase
VKQSKITMQRKVFLPQPLTGIIPPLVTPLSSDRDLDVEGLERLIEHVLSGGVHGLFILGTTGEAPSLSNKIKREIITLTCKKVNGRVPVLVGLTDSSPAESILLAEMAEKAGAAALVAAPPFYFQLSQQELVQYFNYLADHVNLPLFLYNIPSLTKIVIEPDSVKSLSQHIRIVGLKDSSGNATYFNTVVSMMKSDKSFALFIGPDEMMASMVLTGAHGGVSAGANLFPKLYVDLYKACVAGDVSAVSLLQQRVMDISTHIYNGVPAATNYLKGIKAALSVMGICDDFMEFPLRSFDHVEKQTIEKNLSTIKRNQLK